MVGRDKCQSGSDRARRDAKTDGPAVRPSNEIVLAYSLDSTSDDSQWLMRHLGK